MPLYCFIYQQLLEHLEACRDRKLPFQKEVEICFQISFQFRTHLEQYYRQNPCSISEIFYGKHLWPRMATHQAYYQLLYHGLLFEPIDPCDARHFWMREKKRLANLIKQLGDFYVYFKSGATERDSVYFKEQLKEITIYDLWCTSLSCQGSVGLTRLHAMERYMLFVEEKILQRDT
ncbi:MAG TPA: RteC domain-containing protein [Flavisolibacter sp.]|nr:RteC domain-containing protein [Flavisolibacter sp.]